MNNKTALILLLMAIAFNNSCTKKEEEEAIAPRDIPIVFYTNSPTYVSNGYVVYVGPTNLSSSQFISVSGHFQCWYSGSNKPSVNTSLTVDSCDASGTKLPANAKIILKSVSEPITVNYKAFTPVLFGVGYSGTGSVTIDPSTTSGQTVLIHF